MLKTVPSYSNVMSVSSAKNSFSSATTSAGVSFSEIAVKPRMSANMTAARLRTCVCPRREFAQLRIRQDLVGELGRDVAAERRADQLALLNFLRQLLGGQLPARGAYAQQRMDPHQELFAPDGMGQKVVDSRLEGGEPLLRGSRDRQQRQQHRRRIRLEQAADHGQRLCILLRLDHEQIRRAACDARDDLLGRHDVIDDEVGAVDEARKQIAACGARADHQRAKRGRHPPEPPNRRLAGPARQLLLLNS